MWGDSVCADLDIVRHLFAFLYAINWKDGYLFPSTNELCNLPSDGVYTTNIEEDEMYSTLGYIYRTVLRRKNKLGTHAARKFAYLWAQICGAKDTVQVMTAADHDCMKVVMPYERDESAIMEVTKVYKTPKHKLGP